MKILRIGGYVVAAAVLTACGGGSADDDDDGGFQPAPQSPIQGVYEGTISSGRQHQTLILEDNEIFAMYGNLVAGTFFVSGFIQGSGQANNGSFNSTNLKDFFSTGAVVPATMTATYRVGQSFNGTITSGNASATFTGTPIKDSLYNYDTAAKLSNITGTWNMTDLGGSAANLNIATNGSFTGLSGGCTFSGTLTPRPSGKNVFNFSATFGAAPCALPNQAASGIALEYVLATGKRQLIIAGTNNARTAGTALLGER